MSLLPSRNGEEKKMNGERTLTALELKDALWMWDLIETYLKEKGPVGATQWEWEVSWPRDLAYPAFFVTVHGFSIGISKEGSSWCGLVDGCRVWCNDKTGVYAPDIDAAITALFTELYGLIEARIEKDKGALEVLNGYRRRVHEGQDTAEERQAR